MASIKFYATEEDSANIGGTLIDHTNGSGIGFYGAGYGISVPIGSVQDSTWLTNSDGTSPIQIQLNNTKRTASDKIAINGLTAIDMNNLPNSKCPLNIRFTHSEAVKVQTCKVRVFDRNSIANHASGVTTYVFEARHPSSDQAKTNLNHRGRTSNTWYEFDPVDAMSDMTLTNSPGISGTNTDSGDTDTSLGYETTYGPTHQDTRHDWYMALSAEPDSVGSKVNYALYFSCEYV